MTAIMSLMCHFVCVFSFKPSNYLLVTIVFLTTTKTKKICILFLG